MKKQTKKRILSTLLCFMLVIGLLPTVAHAESEVHWCFNCDAIYYGDVDSDVYDDSEGCCGPDGNPECWVEIHCWECGEYVDRYWTNDCCMWCEDCIEDQGTHCTECDECYLSKEDELCGVCHKCEICSGGICPDCGLCDECATDGDYTHCIICGACSSGTTWADEEDPDHPSDPKHCADCCSHCEQCGSACTTDDDVEYCDECGLCVDCCMENREAFGCEVFCVESSEFEDHFCEECGTCWCDTYQCGYCGLCAECCESNSDVCTEHMCVEDSDYDDHFCEECGDCFHEADQCEECGLCKACCEDKLESAQEIRCLTCAGFTCVEQDGFEAHMTESHPEKGYTHDHRFSKSWSMDNDYHWHACLSCENGKTADPDAGGHITDPDTGICKVCGYKYGETMYFITQPEDAHVQVSESHYYGSYYWANPGPTNYWNNRTSFRVKAFSSNGPLYYRWYQVKGDGEPTPLDNNTTDKGKLYVSGATTPTLTISVSMDSCTSDYSYYCVITDGKTTTTPVKSAQAKMVASHRYSLAAYDKDTESGTIYLKTYYDGVGWKSRAQTSTGHKWYCCGTGHDATNAATLNKKAKPHSFEDWGTEEGAYTKEALLDNNCITFNKYRCTDCHYVKYVEKHTCNMEAKAYAEGHEDVATKHQLVCKTAGCDKTGSAPHNWVYVTEGEGYFPRQKPDDADNGKVIRRCIECGYLDINFTWKKVTVTTDTTTGDKTKSEEPLGWNINNILVDVENGTANRPLVEPGDTVVLNPKLDGVHKFTGWTANYHY